MKYPGCRSFFVHPVEPVLVANLEEGCCFISVVTKPARYLTSSQKNVIPSSNLLLVVSRHAHGLTDGANPILPFDNCIHSRVEIRPWGRVIPTVARRALVECTQSYQQQRLVCSSVSFTVVTEDYSSVTIQDNDKRQ